MFSSRFAAAVSVLCLSVSAFAQVTTPLHTQPATMPAIQVPPLQQEPSKAEPVRVQPIKVPPLAVINNGNPVYVRNPNTVNPPPVNSPYPYNPAVAAPTNPQPSANPAAYPNPNPYPPNPAYPGNPNPNFNANGAAPIRVAAAPTATFPYSPPAPAPAGAPLEQPVHVGRAEPASRIVPFFLSPEEQAELDAFLIRWEKHSTNIKRYDVDFNLFIYDPTIPGAVPNKPHKVAFGYFKYIANPLRFIYHVEGEWQGNKQIKRDGDKNPNIFAEKSIINPQTVFRYDYNAKTVIKINVPPELIGKGIADSPLPLIFGAKADDLKRRFSMKIMPTAPKDTRMWLHARPLLIEDQQEFKQLEILLDKQTLEAVGLKEYDINDKAYKVFELKDAKINNNLDKILDALATMFKTDAPMGWRLEEHTWAAPASMPSAAPSAMLPPANRQNEIPLYRGN
ncbi:MAG: hypothetical protein LBH00_01000 [Planctomycetaceae bacterium]|jgi:TIGR03009 family protein|nr:hypothetical protein [Planctomycetaceae bacterium]